MSKAKSESKITPTAGDYHSFNKNVNSSNIIEVRDSSSKKSLSRTISRISFLNQISNNDEISQE